MSEFGVDFEETSVKGTSFYTILASNLPKNPTPASVRHDLVSYIEKNRSFVEVTIVHILSHTFF